MYITGETRQSIGAAIALGICLLLGLAIAGHYVGEGAARLKSDNHTISVRGLVEKEVKADKAVWTLNLRYVSNDFEHAHTKINAEREATMAFLRRREFKDEEIERQPTTTEIERQSTLTIDKEGREYGQLQATERFRYVVTTSVVVKTSNVDRVKTALGATEELLKSGVVLDGERKGNAANPRYIISTFSTIQPQLLTEATKNALTTAQQFASDAGVALGRIRSANQGMIQVFGSDGNDESGPYSSTSSITKKIRVVSTFEFDLK
jgi:hypothetical protein